MAIIRIEGIDSGLCIVRRSLHEPVPGFDQYSGRLRLPTDQYVKLTYTEKYKLFYGNVRSLAEVWHRLGSRFAGIVCSFWRSTRQICGIKSVFVAENAFLVLAQCF